MATVEDVEEALRRGMISPEQAQAMRGKIEGRRAGEQISKDEGEEEVSLADQALRFGNVAASGTASGLANVLDLPTNLTNLVVGEVASLFDTEAPQLPVPSETTGFRGTFVRAEPETPAERVVSSAGEFVGGAAPFFGLPLGGTAARIAASPSNVSTARNVAQSIVRPALANPALTTGIEAGASGAAGLAGQGVEEAGGGPAARLAAELIAGAGVGAAPSVASRLLRGRPPVQASQRALPAPQLALPAPQGALPGPRVSRAADPRPPTRREIRAAQAIAPTPEQAARLRSSSPTARAAARKEISDRQAAMQAVRQAFQDDLLTNPAQVSKRAERLGPEATLADVGGTNVRSTLRGAVSQPGKGQRRIEALFKRRGRTQAGRLKSAVRSVLSEADFVDTSEAIIERRREASGPLYTEARAAGQLQSEAIQKAVQDPLVKNAIKVARREVGELEGLPDTDIRVLDEAYKTLGGRAQSARESKRNRTKANRLTNSQFVLRDAIVEELPVYGKALDAYSDDSSLLDAMKRGRNFIKEDADITTRQLAGMPESEREMFLIGATRAMVDQINSVQDTADVTKRIFGNRKKRDLVRSLFEDKASFDQFKAAVLRESVMAETANQTLPSVGSQTQPRQAAVKDLAAKEGRIRETAADVAETATGGMGKRTLASRAMRRFFSDTGGPSREMSEQIADILLKQGVEPNKKMIDEIFREATILNSRRR